MRRYENECVGCPTELGCLGKSCPYSNVPVDYCDICKEGYAKYKIGEEYYCEQCMNDYLQEVFNSLTIAEKAEAVDIEISKINVY